MKKPAPSLVSLTLSGSPLILRTNGTTGSLTATNQSTDLTATNIRASLTGTALDGKVTQDASQCASVGPQQSCTLTFTPGPGVVPPTSVTIQGDNTSPISAGMAILPSPQIPLTLSGSPLALVTGGGSGTMTVTNTSSTLTALNIVADLTGTPLAGQVMQDSSQCVSVAPGQSCSLIFTPGTTTISQTNFPITGSNTQQVAGSIIVTTSSQAPIIVSGSSLTLTVGGTLGTLTITNQSSTVTATNVRANITGTALDGKVIQNASQCTSVGPQQSCTLSFSPGPGAVPATNVLIHGDNTIQASATISINPAPQAPLTLSGSPLTLEAGGSSGTMTVTNTSSTLTALNVAANFTGTALAGQVTQDSSQCASVAPAQSCSLIFTPGTTAITQTSFPIKGSNTEQVAGIIGVATPTQANIVVSGSPLTLTAGGASGTLTVTNQSTVLTAINISANLAGTALDGKVTQDASNCTSVLPQQSCVLGFTPSSVAVTATTVAVSGVNTSQEAVSIAINAAPQAPISITGGQNMTLFTNDPNAVGWMVIQNNSSSVPATNIVANFAGTSLNGQISQSSTTCTSVAPGATCTLYFVVSGTTDVPSTSFGVAGDNTTQETGNLAITTVALGQSVGTSLNGGLIGSLNVTPTGPSNCGTTASTRYMVVSPTESNLLWDSSSTCIGGTCTLTNATTMADGSSNTNAITSTLSGLPGVVSTDYSINPFVPANYAAGWCSSLEIDESGQTPCQSGVCYKGWYLPARTELACLFNNRFQLNLSSANYWSSNEVDANSAWYRDFPTGFTVTSLKGVVKPSVCVRTITN